MTDTYFLSSLESTRFEPVRRCVVQESLIFDSGKPLVRAAIDPPVVGQDFGRPDITTVFLAARHEGVSVDPVSEFPCFVFIALPPVGREHLASPVRSDDLEIIGWGELYRTDQDAERHSFD